MAIEHEVLNSSDHAQIASRFYVPSSDPKGAVFIASAMGVSQKYYEPLALWLSEKGFLVVTFDYRGTGDSLKGDLRGLQADLFDWAKDCSAVLEELVNRAKNSPVFWIGHSLGGQIVPLVTNIGVVSKVITVASGSGYWLENAWPLKRRVWWLWYVVVPLTLPLFGYFPGKRLRKVGNLPKGVMAQWRRWCLNPEYCVGYEGAAVKKQFEEISIPIVSLAFVDDELMSRLNIESLHGFFVNAPVRISRIDPSDIGASGIGHFGFFKKKFEESLWSKYLLVELN